MKAFLKSAGTTLAGIFLPSGRSYVEGQLYAGEKFVVIGDISDPGMRAACAVLREELVSSRYWRQYVVPQSGRHMGVTQFRQFVTAYANDFKGLEQDKWSLTDSNPVAPELARRVGDAVGFVPNAYFLILSTEAVGVSLTTMPYRLGSEEAAPFRPDDRATGKGSTTMLQMLRHCGEQYMGTVVVNGKRAGFTSKRSDVDVIKLAEKLQG